VILLDTSGLLAAIDRSQRLHDAAVTALRAATPPWMLSPFVLAELDYLLATRVGQAAERELLAEVGRGVYRVRHRAVRGAWHRPGGCIHRRPGESLWRARPARAGRAALPRAARPERLSLPPPAG